MKNSEPDLKHLQSPFSLNITAGGESYLYFSGTAYLGIPKSKAFMDLYLEGLQKYGLNNGTSRSNNIQLGIYNEAEDYAALYFGAEAGLITSSGYLAAQMLVRHYATYGTILYAPQTHPALWLNAAPAITGTFKDWAKRTVMHINGSQQNRWVLVSNSLNNLFPERYDFSFLQDIDPENKVILIADDSHGIGLLDEGRGVLNTIAAPSHIKVVVVASMAKALGIDAGVILGPQAIIRNLKSSNEFMGASPPAAASLYAFMRAGGIYHEELDKLHTHMRQFSAALGVEEWGYIEDYPVYLSKDPGLYKKLLKKNILISSFSYPDQNGPVLNRVVLSSWADWESIQQLVRAIY